MVRPVCIYSVYYRGRWSSCRRRGWPFPKAPSPSLTVGAIRDVIWTFRFLLVLQIINILGKYYGNGKETEAVPVCTQLALRFFYSDEGLDKGGQERSQRSRGDKKLLNNQKYKRNTDLR